MKKPFYKLKRFYIPCVIFIVLIIFASLAYHFLQQPLELIFWDDTIMKKIKLEKIYLNYSGATKKNLKKFL